MILNKLLNKKVIKFFFVGSSGIIINLLITGVLQFFVFEREQFYLASIIGTCFNILYNFTLHSLYTFNTKSNHRSRFAKFVLYTLILASFQEYLLKIITPMIGIDFLVIIKGFLVLFFSVFTFIFFNYVLFNEK